MKLTNAEVKPVQPMNNNEFDISCCVTLLMWKNKECEF